MTPLNGGRVTHGAASDLVIGRAVQGSNHRLSVQLDSSTGQSVCMWSHSRVTVQMAADRIRPAELRIVNPSEAASRPQQTHERAARVSLGPLLEPL